MSSELTGLAEKGAGNAPDGLEALFELARSAPDLYGDVVVEYDFKGEPDHQRRAAALLEVQRHAPEAKAMYEAEIADAVRENTGTDNTDFFEIAVFEDGTRAYCKLAYKMAVTRVRPDQRLRGHERTLRECSAYVIACLLGPRFRRLVPPVVLKKHDGRICALIREVPNASGPRSGDTFREDQLRAAAIFDALLANSDRLQHNYLLDEAGDLHLIDHEWTLDADFGAGSQFVRDWRERGWTLADTERKALEAIGRGPRRRVLEGILSEKQAAALLERAERFLGAGTITP